MLAHCNDHRPEPTEHRDDLPEACRQIISKAMGKAPADRYARIEEMKADLFVLFQQLTEDAPDTQAATKIQRQHAPNDDVSGASTDPTTQHTYQTLSIGKVQHDGQFDFVWVADKAVPPKPYPQSRPRAHWRAMLHDLFSERGSQ